jgi:hypothetical protein
MVARKCGGEGQHRCQEMHCLLDGLVSSLLTGW